MRSHLTQKVYGLALSLEQRSTELFRRSGNATCGTEPDYNSVPHHMSRAVLIVLLCLFRSHALVELASTYLNSLGYLSAMTEAFRSYDRYLARRTQ